MTHWHAGWSQPGCLPETPYVVFGDRMQAQRYIAEELERLWDEVAGTDVEPEAIDAHTAWHNGAGSVWADRYRFEMTPEAGCTCGDGELSLQEEDEEDE